MSKNKTPPGSKRRQSPSVMSFLAKLQSPREGAEGKTPARGLLGDISREDLVAAGRLEADGDEAHDASGASGAFDAPEALNAPDVVETEPLSAQVTRATTQGDFDERYEDLVDADAKGAGSTRALRRAALGQNRRSDRRPWSARVEIRGVFGSDPADDVLRGARAGKGNAGPVATNLSLGGVFVETTALLDVGDPVMLSLPSPDGQPLSVSGRVRWVTPFGRVTDARPGMGIEFVGLDEHKKRRLEDLLQRLPGRRADGRS